MTEIHLVRHGKAEVNVTKEVGIANVLSPLTEKGIEQSISVGNQLRDEYDIDPSTHKGAVAASEYTRAQQSAFFAGFRNVHILSLINESEFTPEDLEGVVDIKLKHAQERWVPEETAERVAQHINLIRTGELGYTVYFAHGMYCAGFLLHLAFEAEEQGIPFPYEYDEQRGFIPDNGQIITVQV